MDLNIVGAGLLLYLAISLFEVRSEITERGTAGHYALSFVIAFIMQCSFMVYAMGG